MTTEPTTINLPPCPLTGCEGGEHHYHDVEAYDVYAVGGTHDCATEARFGFRCYGPHRPGLSERIDLPEVTDEMVWLATNTYTRGSYSDEGMRDALAEFRDALLASVPQWQPIEHDQIEAGMRIRATTPIGDRDGMSTYGHLTGQLTLTISGNAIELGSVQVPVTGFLDRGQLRLTADTHEVADTVRKLFAQSSAPEAVVGDE